MVQIGHSYEVDSYFRMHRGCNVTLYQDTKVPTHNSCWKDLYYSIEGAQNIICITGWSVWTKLKLFRGEEAVSIYGGTLGELLARKADQGVEVKVMVWEERKEGILGTHDMETYRFFKNPQNYR